MVGTPLIYMAMPGKEVHMASSMDTGNVKVVYNGDVFYVSKLYRLNDGHLVVASNRSDNPVRINRVFYVQADSRRKALYSMVNKQFTIVTKLSSFFGLPTDLPKMMKSIMENIAWEEKAFELMRDNPYAKQRHDEIMAIKDKINNTPALNMSIAV
jgi:hypothetical protein